MLLGVAGLARPALQSLEECMIEAPLLRDLLVLFAAAIPIVFVFQRLNVPTLVGFLIAGVVIGPHGLGLIGDARPDSCWS